MKTTTKSIKGFTLVKPTSQQGKHIQYVFDNRYEGSDIYDVYGKPSYAKVRAFNYCVELAKAYNAYTYKITGANTCTFTFQFAFYRKNTRTGEVKRYIAHITRDYNYLVEAQ